MRNSHTAPPAPTRKRLALLTWRRRPQTDQLQLQLARSLARSPRGIFSQASPDDATPTLLGQRSCLHRSQHDKQLFCPRLAIKEERICFMTSCQQTCLRNGAWRRLSVLASRPAPRRGSGKTVACREGFAHPSSPRQAHFFVRQLAQTSVPALSDSWGAEELPHTVLHLPATGKWHDSSSVAFQK